MATHQVTEEQLGAALVAQQHDQHGAIVQGLYSAALRAMPHAVADTPADRGRARAAWDVIQLPDGADLFNDTPYAGILEEGSRPHYPPLKPILRWVVRKFGIALDGGRRSFETIDQVPHETILVARSICQKIALRGTRAHHMIGGNFKLFVRIARRVVNRALGGTE